MNKIYKTLQKAILGGFILGLMAISPANAQLDEIQAFLSSGPENATLLTRAYLSPLPTGLGTGLNSGWTTKAKPTKTLGFSLQLRVAGAQVPSSGQSFDARTLGLQNVDITGVSSNTISGGDVSGQTISAQAGSGDNYSFNVPGGTGFEYVPVAMIQGNIGLIKSTDLTVRFIPETSLGSYGDISVIGAGIKHDLNQWLPGGKLLPVDISVMAAFSQTNLNADITFNGGTDQRIETSTNTFVLNALVGKTLPFISVYGGVGYQKASFELDILGDYVIGSTPFTTTISDPVSYTQDSDAGIHALAGFQFKLGPVRLYAEATAAEFFTANAGIGIGIR